MSKTSEKATLASIRALKSVLKTAIKDSRYCGRDWKKQDAYSKKAQKDAVSKAVASMTQGQVRSIVLHDYDIVDSKWVANFREKMREVKNKASEKWEELHPTKKEQYEILLHELEQKELEAIVGAVNEATVKAWLAKVLAKIESIKSKE